MIPPPDLPKRPPTTSTAALPSILTHHQVEYQAISFVESNSEYFVALLNTF
jgi:hypothetical protein